jgi:small subunit ribosomal protein S8e
MKHGRKTTSGRYKARSKKRKHSLGRVERNVRIKDTKTKIIKVRGKHKKLVLLGSNKANLINKENKAKVVNITNVLETTANRFWARQNRMVKGAIIETDLGKAKITNRPSQEGTINAVLIDELKSEKK